jgi:hypothetical protein
MAPEAVENCPKLQAEQLEPLGKPVPVLNVPAEQLRQVLRERAPVVGENFPGGHRVQLEGFGKPVPVP